jgi:outer membrane protein
VRACARGLVLLACLAMAASARAETLNGALAQAYSANPNLAAGRAGVRAIDESVPQALAGLRPQVTGDARLGAMDRRNVADSREETNNDPTSWDWVHSVQSGRATPRTGVLSVEQPIFDGFKTQNATSSAQSNVLAARQRLRLLEQRVLLQAVTAYMDVLRESAAVRLQQNNVQVLTEQLRQTRERFEYGQITPTDVAQAEARLAAGRADESAARATLEAKLGQYRQIIGEEPKRLAPAQPIDKLLPRTREEAEALALVENPVIVAATHDADAADLNIHVAEGDFMPKVSVLGNVFTQTDLDGRGNRSVGASVVGKLTVPFYDGGLTPSRVRQAKEIAGQKLRDADAARAEVMALVRANWGAWQAAQTQLSAAQTQIKAAEKALNGVREEAKAGQRTTIEVLNAQFELLNARLALLTAQRDRVVASYAVLGTVGRLSAERLALAVEIYDPALHFEQVKDGWIFPNTPDGK